MMDKNNINTTGSHDDNVVRTSDFQPFSCPTAQEIVYGGTTRRTTTFECGSSSGSKSSDFNIPCNLKYQQNPRKKKRTKLIKIDGSNNISKPKYGKRPDPTAPKIISPCSQCGKKFWSEKALFGHMRCHPERQWRGMNPPPNFTYPPPASVTSSVVTNPENPEFEVRMSVEDREVATCLLMLANGGRVPSFSESPTVTTARDVVSDPDFLVFRDPNTLMGCRGDFVDSEVVAAAGGGPSCGRFECSSCKKVFGSHQALGGHRASHKNVKGCFAIHKNGTDDDDDQEQQQDHGHLFGEIEVVNKDDDNLVAVYDHGWHKCGICLRVFSSGQALGGHKRCHWEKGEDHGRLSFCGFDLNLPPPMPLAPVDSLGVALDLRLGL